MDQTGLHSCALLVLSAPVQQSYRRGPANSVVRVMPGHGRQDSGKLILNKFVSYRSSTTTTNSVLSLGTPFSAVASHEADSMSPPVKPTQQRTFQT